MSTRLTFRKMVKYYRCMDL